MQKRSIKMQMKQYHGVIFSLALLFSAGADRVLAQSEQCENNWRTAEDHYNNRRLPEALDLLRGIETACSGSIAEQAASLREKAEHEHLCNSLVADIMQAQRSNPAALCEKLANLDANGCSDAGIGRIRVRAGSCQPSAAEAEQLCREAHDALARNDRSKAARLAETLSVKYPEQACASEILAGIQNKDYNRRPRGEESRGRSSRQHRPQIAQSKPHTDPTGLGNVLHEVARIDAAGKSAGPSGRRGGQEDREDGRRTADTRQRVPNDRQINTTDRQRIADTRQQTPAKANGTSSGPRNQRADKGEAYRSQTARVTPATVSSTNVGTRTAGATQRAGNYTGALPTNKIQPTVPTGAAPTGATQRAGNYTGALPVDKIQPTVPTGAAPTGATQRAGSYTGALPANSNAATAGATPTVDDATQAAYQPRTAGAAAPTTTTYDADSYYSEAQRHFDRREYYRAYERVRTALTYNPNYGSARKLLDRIEKSIGRERKTIGKAIGLYYDGQYENSRRELRPLIAASGISAPAAALGEFYQGANCLTLFILGGETDASLQREADLHFRQARALDPNFKPPSRIISARVYRHFMKTMSRSAR